MAVLTTQNADFMLIELAIPGTERVPAGVLLHDPSRDRLFLRLRRDWEEIAPEEAEVLGILETDLAAKAVELGAARLIEYLEGTLSNVVRLEKKQATVSGDFERDLHRLYRAHVHASVREFVTHLPRYSLAVAAGKFLENAEVTGEGWVEAPPDLKLTRDMFAAQVVGRSMEPLIPDGSMCVFRAGVTGSRQGRLVLVESLGRGGNDRYTVKRYRSEKTSSQSGEGWAHTRIRLEPLNPEFEAWELDPREEAELRIIAEFVRLLE